MITLGIDIGLTGALAALDARGSVCIEDLPTTTASNDKRRLDGRALLTLVRKFVPPGEPCVVVIEDVQARPMGNGGGHGNTMHSQGSLMRSRGLIEGVLDMMGPQTTVRWVQPQAWKRHYGLLKAEKGASMRTAQGLYPTAPLSLVKHHNRAEALLLAHYGRAL